MRSSARRSLATAFVVASAVAAAACGGGSSGLDTSDLTVEQRLGLEVAQHQGCASCHGSTFGGGVGPTWHGLAGSQVTLEDGTTVVADSAYLTESIAAPSAKVVQGSTIAMPRNDLTDAEIAQVVAYIEALG